MKLSEALRLVAGDSGNEAPGYTVHLACGVMPLHLKTFLHARLIRRLPGHRVQVETGLFGDLAGNMERAAASGASAAAAVIEWSDIDPRLGLRSLGGWDPRTLMDVISEAPGRLARVQAAVASAAASMPVAVMLPTLPLPPLSFTPTWLGGSFELRLKAVVSAFAAELCAIPRVRVANLQHLDEKSPLADRYDVASEVTYGFPYEVAHAEAIAAHLVTLIAPPPPKKGLITDLDDTLWLGILGEVGVDGISWDLDHKSQIHGVYQQFLHSLSRAGVLIAAASKNDPEMVERAFARADLLLPKSSVFPIEASWGPKSAAISRILRRWNIAADAVVFLDDSPMEVAEVRAAFPAMECLVFPRNKPAEMYAQLCYLRDAFGKESLEDEDAFRLASIRNAELFEQQTQTDPAALDGFLAGANATITFTEAKQPPDSRALELVNKTNQFNLNGRRHTEAEWLERLADPASFVVVVSYQDKYGPLGKIAVVSGRICGQTAHVDVWVMSCRAFSRRIEHATLRHLFSQYGVEEIALKFQPTERNGPASDFLASILGSRPSGECRISRRRFDASSPQLFHTITEAAHG